MGESADWLSLAQPSVSGGIAAPKGQFTPNAPVAAPTPTADPYQGQRFDNRGPGTGGYTQTPVGWDASSPGVGEQMWNQNQGAFINPTQGTQYFAQHQDQFAPGQGGQFYDQNAGAYGNSDMAAWQHANGGAFDQAGQGEQFWNQVQGKMNGGPGFDAYYDRARERQSGAMNDQLATRGAYGNSAGVDQISQGLADLNAQQANREADYDLNKTNAFGQLAFGAQNLGMNRVNNSANLAQMADQTQLNRLNSQGQMAGQADQLGLSRLLGGMNSANQVDATNINQAAQGMNAATTAQGLRRERGRDYMGDIYSPYQQLSAQQGAAMSDMLSQDQNLMDQSISLEMGQSAEDLAQTMNAKNSGGADTGMLMQLLSLLGMAGGV